MNANRGYRRGFVLGAVLVFAFAMLPTDVRAAGRQITDLGTLGGVTAFARDINEPGQLVGESTTAADQTHAFLFTPWVGKMVDLGTLGGTFSQAIAISNLAGKSFCPARLLRRRDAVDRGTVESRGVSNHR